MRRMRVKEHGYQGEGAQKARERQAMVGGEEGGSCRCLGGPVLLKVTRRKWRSDTPTPFPQRPTPGGSVAHCLPQLHEIPAPQVGTLHPDVYLHSTCCDARVLPTLHIEFSYYQPS